MTSRLHADDQSADLVFTGGEVLSLDEEGTRHRSLAVTDGTIVSVDDDRCRALIGQNTRVIELDGRALVPGINDSHLHAVWLGAMWPRTVFGPEQEDAAPVQITSHAQRRAAIERAGALLASLGITSYTEPGIGPGEDDGETGCFASDAIQAYRALAEEGRLRSRVSLLMLFGQLDGPSRVDDVVAGVAEAHREPAAPDQMFRISGVKIFGDGIPPMRQAWTFRRYTDGSSGGLLVLGEDEREREANLREMIRQAHRGGLQVGVHATGDRTIQVCVDEFSRCEERSPKDLRHHIVHGDLLRSEEQEVMLRSGIGVTVQAGIADATAEWLRAELGDEGLRNAWPISEALRRGVDLSLSTDAPILSPDWRAQIAAADRWMGPGDEETSRLHALLRAYTAVPARQDGAEGWKGVLKPGFAADLCVLRDDPFSQPIAALPDNSVELTVCAGRVVYDAADAAREVPPAPAASV